VRLPAPPARCRGPRSWRPRCGRLAPSITETSPVWNIRFVRNTRNASMTSGPDARAGSRRATGRPVTRWISSLATPGREPGRSRPSSNTPELGVQDERDDERPRTASRLGFGEKRPAPRHAPHRRSARCGFRSFDWSAGPLGDQLPCSWPANTASCGLPAVSALIWFVTSVICVSRVAVRFIEVGLPLARSRHRRAPGTRRWRAWRPRSHSGPVTLIVMKADGIVGRGRDPRPGRTQRHREL